MDISRLLKKHSATILCLIASAGVITTAVLAVKETPKAIELLKKAEEEKQEELTTIEKIRTTAPAYIPALVSGAMTIACLFCANTLNRKQQVSLASAYGLVSSQYKRYSDKVRELCGEETHKTILESIAIEKSEEVHITAPSILGGTSLEIEGIEEPKLLFYDPLSERYFESTYSRVLQAEYHINRNYALRDCVTLNDYYLFLGIDKVDVGDDVGWSQYESEIIWIDFDHISSSLDDGTPYVMICVAFGPEPFYSECA